MSSLHGHISLIYDYENPIFLDVRNENLIEESICCAYISIGSLNDNDNHIDETIYRSINRVNLIQ